MSAFNCLVTNQITGKVHIDLPVSFVVGKDPAMGLVCEIYSPVIASYERYLLFRGNFKKESTDCVIRQTGALELEILGQLNVRENAKRNARFTLEGQQHLTLKLETTGIMERFIMIWDRFAKDQFVDDMVGFGLGVYTGIYISQNYPNCPKVEDPATYLEKLKVYLEEQKKK